jgi:hypothetical protein
MGATITSITGLQNLVNLQEFRADYNSLTSVDLSGMSSLTFVDISDNDVPGESTNSLTSVNLSGCTSIQDIRLDDSNFSAGLPNLSSLSSIRNIDFDQCGLTGTINISNLATLENFDLGGNTNLNNVIISRNQPLGTGDITLSFGECALTQDAVNNILIELANNNITSSNASVYMIGENNAAPSGSGVEALYTLNDRGWTMIVNSPLHTTWNLASQPDFGSICSDTNRIDYFTLPSDTLTAGLVLYTDYYLYLTASNAWYSDGAVRFEVIDGVIQTPVGCA